MVLLLDTTASVQTSTDGTPAAYLSIDQNWANNAELQDASNNNIIIYDLKGISFIVNEISDNTGFVEKPANFLDGNGNLLSNVILGSPDVVSGNKYLMRLRYKFVHKTDGSVKYGETGNASIFITSQPVTPGDISSTIRAEDSGISINISQLYTYNSPSDGYDAITKIIYYISKVGGDTTSDLLIDAIPINNNATTGTPEYDEWHTITNLDNGAKYEIAYRLANNIGESGLSQTFTITPSDLPSQIIQLTATNNFTDLVDSNVTSASTSIINFYWQKPPDYDNLKGPLANKPVTKYTIKMQEVAWNNETLTYENVGAVVENVLPHDANAVTRPSYELSSTSPAYSLGYHYVYSYQKAESDFGKIFQFSVFASNSNGDGPESVTSNKIASYINPTLQVFEVVHETNLVATIGTPVTVHTGKLGLSLTTLSSLNGMKDSIQDVDLSNNIFKSNGIDRFKTRTVKMKLVVESSQAMPVTIFNNEVDFVQQYSVAQQTFLINGIETQRSVGTLLDEWLIEDINTIPNFGILILGTKYKYTLYRLGNDPVTDNNTLTSTPQEILRTHFESPSSIGKIQAYAFNDDFTPVLVNGNPGVRVLFEQITDASMNGTNVFITETNQLEYEIRSNSQPIAGVDRLAHDSSLTTRQFEIQSILGVTNNLYVRVYIKNPELQDLEIEGVESSPAVQESAKTYPSAVTLLSSVVDPSGTLVTVTWLKQTLSGLGGFNSLNVVNRVYLYDETTATNPVQSLDVPYNSTQTATFNGLTLGNIYKIYVLSLGKYSKSNLDETGNKFNGSEIRQYYAKTAITAVGTPGAPTNVEVYPGVDKVTFNYDPVTKLRGNNPDNFMYHFILNSDSTYFPYQNDLKTLVQASVSNVAGSDEAIVSTGYTNVDQSNSRANASSLQIETLYRYALYIVSSVGNEDILNVSDTLDAANGTALTLVPLAKTPLKELMGNIYYNNDFLLINNNVPTPEIAATAGEEQIRISIKKPANPPNELIIVLDNNDALDKTDAVIPIFSTMNVRDTVNSGVSGLFALENADRTAPIGNVDYGTNGYNFEVVNQGGVQTYYVTIKKLVNGRTHNVQVRFANTFNNYDYYSEVSTLLIAAEAPPTAPRNATFAVANKLINLSWDDPLNSGGAGQQGNSELLYEVTVTNGTSQVFQLNNILNRFLTLDTSNFPTIANGVSYSVKILAYYIKGGNEVKSTATAIQAVKPNVAPESPTATITLNNNRLEVSITTVSSTQSTLYPLDNLIIHYKKSNETSYTPSKTFDSLDGINDGSISLSHIISNLRNGESYDVKIEAVPAYNYAQKPTDVINNNLIPFGSPVVFASTAIKPAGNSRALDVSVNLNGSGPISQIIALAKTLNSTVIGILNLSSATLPTITTSGTETQDVAGNQIATFRIDFQATIPGSLSDAIIIVNTLNGTDAGVYSTSVSGSQYFVDGV